MAFRSFKKFEECRLRLRYIGNWRKVKQLLWWNGWLTFGFTSELLRRQGISILINKGFGPAMNSSWNVGNTLSSHTATLSGSLLGAFYPAVYNAWGAGRFEYAKSMGYRVCRLSVLLVLLFAVPLSLEVDHVLLLWLKNPPQYSSGLCLFVLSAIISEKMTDGIRFIINANGNIALYQTLVGGIGLIALPLALVFVLFGKSIYYVGMAVAVSWFLQSSMRVYLGQKILNMNIVYWIRNVFLPIMFLIVTAVIAGMMPRFLCAPSLLRIFFTSACTSITISGGSWLVLLNAEEKKIILNKVHIIINKVMRV